MVTCFSVYPYSRRADQHYSSVECLVFFLFCVEIGHFFWNENLISRKKKEQGQGVCLCVCAYVWMNVSLQTYRFIVYTLLVAFVLVLLSCFNTRYHRQYSPALKTSINDIVDAAAKRVVTAQACESNAFLELHNASYARGMLEALKLIAPSEDLVHLANVRFADLDREARRQEWLASQRLFQECPHIVPGNALANVAGWYPAKAQHLY
jgi:hypothetical protein